MGQQKDRRPCGQQGGPWREIIRHQIAEKKPKSLKIKHENDRLMVFLSLSRPTTHARGLRLPWLPLASDEDISTAT